MSAQAATIQAAGALCWRRSGAGRLEVLVVHSPRYDEWSWPKGKPEAVDGVMEWLPVCAVREVAEESGVTVRLGRRLPSVRYRMPDGRPKEVTYWVGRPVHDGAPTAHLDEIDAQEWIPAESARERLSRPGDHRPLDKLLKLDKRGRLDTRALIVARHAEAVPRSEWTGTDADRPLTDQGRQQAEAMVSLLGCWRPHQLLTSPWVRCRETMRPYAKSDHDPLLEAPELTEDTAVHDPNAAAALIQRMGGLAAADGDLAVCTHRPVIGVIMDVFRQLATSGARDDLPTKDPWLAKGELLVAHVSAEPAGPRIRAVERHGVAVS